jgi:hypothetical protein
MHTIFLKKNNIQFERNISFTICLKSNLHRSITQIYERHIHDINYICRTRDHRLRHYLIGQCQVLQDRPKMEIVQPMKSDRDVGGGGDRNQETNSSSTDLYFNREHVNMSMLLCMTSMMYNSGCEYNDCILLNRREMNFCMAYDDRHKIFFGPRHQV